MIAIALDRASDQPLYTQIREAVRNALAEGRLQPGDRLPPVAVWAGELGVTPSTVRRALEDLTSAGLTRSFVGRGTFIAEPSAPAPATAPAAETPRRPRLPGDPEMALAARRLRAGIARSLEALLPLSRRPGLISFTAGVPDVELTPPSLLEELGRAALSRGGRELLGYGDPMGLLPLREEVARRFRDRGANVGTDQVLITTGSQQAVALLAEHALEQRLRVFCETPCYMGIPNAFSALGHWVEAVTRDAEGPDPVRLNALEDGQPALLYTCPELHNPTGTDMSLERRRELGRWAQATGSLVIADEVFVDLHVDGPGPPGLLEEVGAAHVAVVGSLSKSFMCGLRVGWLVSSAERVQGLVGFKRAMDLGGPPLVQAMALEAFLSGAYDAHLPRVQERYRERRDATLAALKRRIPPGVRWSTPAGGFHLWCELPRGYSSISLYLAAIERGVVVMPGPFSDVDHRNTHAFRLSFGSLAPETIAEGVDLLAEAVNDLLARPPEDRGLSALGDLF